MRRNERDIVNDRFASAITENRGRTFWNEVKKMQGNNRSQRISTVDGLTSEGDVADLFTSQYQELYDSIAYDINDMNNLRNDIN